VAIQAAAAAFGLPFVALAQERVELVVHPSAPDVASALGRALSDSRLWAQVLALAGYERLAP
jgi:molybdate-binding protein